MRERFGKDYIGNVVLRDPTAEEAIGYVSSAAAKRIIRRITQSGGLMTPTGTGVVSPNPSTVQTRGYTNSERAAEITRLSTQLGELNLLRTTRQISKQEFAERKAPLVEEYQTFNQMPLKKRGEVKMANPDTAPELFTNRNIIPEAGKCKTRIPVNVPITVEGLYNGNGQYRNAKGRILPITGFDKLTGEWFGRGFTEKVKNSI